MLLAFRSLFWTVVLPGMIAGYIPWRFFGVSQTQLSLTDPLDLLGLLIAAIGVAILGACIWDFARRGRGTLSPVDPPKQLVVQGLYRYVRNPMYVGVSSIILGEALLTRSLALLAYWAVFFTLANLFVIFYEEPALRLQFGDSYVRYTRDVGRWLPF